MKKIIFLIFFLMISLPALGQEETLISGKIENGGYGAPVVKFSSIKNNFAVFVGGYGGWLINHTFMIGGGGFGLVNKIKGDQSAKVFYGFLYDIKIEFGYGGLILEYIGRPNHLIHYSVSALIGGGGVYYSDYGFDMFNQGDFENKHTSTVFVFEPGMNAELNITSFFRIDAGISYRIVAGSDIFGLSNDDLGGISGNLSFKFGKF